VNRFARLTRYVLRQWPSLGAIVPLTIASAAIVALRPWPMKLLVDYALSGSEGPGSLEAVLGRLGLPSNPVTLVVLAAVASLGFSLLGSLLGAALSLAWAAGGQRMVHELGSDLFYRLQRMSLLFHGRTSVGDSLSRLIDDTWCVQSVTNGLLVAPLQQILTLAAMGVTAFALDPSLAALSLVMAPLLAGSASYFGGRLKRRARLERDAQSRVVSFVHQTLVSIPVVQAFNAEKRHQERFRHLARESVSLTRRGNLLNSKFGLVNSLITTSGTAVVLVLGGIRVLSGEITLGSLLVFLAYVRTMQEASQGLFKTFAKLKAAEASIDRVFEILETEDAVHEAPDARPLHARAEGHVRIEDVTFGYEPGRPVLRGISLEARPGETVALVGATGAGKSTLVSLLPRFFDPWHGRVTLDGLDVKQLRLASLRDNVSVVLQEDFLLPLSVAENIAYGRPGATEDQIEGAAEAACAGEFIRRLPEGYETILAESGRTLSGGERRRLAIARALLKDAPVLILDEPTSAVDARTEAELLQGMRRLIRGRTTFIIAHRLSTIRGADRIAVMDEGKLVESGTHEELMRLGGHYHRLYSTQLFDRASDGVA
jgi:ATP-binding cassette subfamily B protein/subfamily B ATP-binding cassette protein MsbA